MCVVIKIHADRGPTCSDDRVLWCGGFQNISFLDHLGQVLRHYEEVELIVWHRVTTGQAHIGFVIEICLMNSDTASGMLCVFVQSIT